PPPPPTDEEQLQGAVGGAPATQPKKNPAQECRVTCKLDFKVLLQKLSKLDVYCLSTGYQGPLGRAARPVLDTVKRSLKRLVVREPMIFQAPGIGLSLESKIFELMILLCLLSQGFLPLDPLNPEQPILDPRAQGPWQDILKEMLFTTMAGENIWRHTHGEPPRHPTPPSGNEIEIDGGGPQAAASGTGRGATRRRDPTDDENTGRAGNLGMPLSDGDVDDDDEDPWSPDNQRALLSTAFRVCNIFNLG
ncbi:hypothetical protein X556_0828, partial [Chlamydia pneumoniae B21]